MREKNMTFKITNVLMLLMLTASLYSQTLTEQIGGINTDYQILSDTNRVDVFDQVIIKRGLSKSETDYDDYDDGAFGYGYGYGLQTYRLEFITTSYIRMIGYHYSSSFKYDLQFFDSDKNVLLKILLDRKDILNYSNGEDLRVYSVNLQQVPLIILNHTKTIKISIIKE